MASRGVVDVMDVIQELEEIKAARGREIFHRAGLFRIVTVASQMDFWIDMLYRAQDVNVEIPDGIADVTRDVCAYLDIGAIKYS